MTTPPRHRHWSDWVGVAAFTVLGINLWRQAPAFGLLVLPTLLQELLVAISFLLRGRASQTATGWRPRVVTYAHTFVVMGFLLYAAARHPDWIRSTPLPALRTAGTLIWLTGACLALWPLWYLRRSFSLEPAARTLVISGPYRFARHPIYAVYLLINLGIFLGHLTPAFAMVLAAWLGLTIVRIRYEEAVLAHAFPEYLTYRQRVGAFGLRLGIAKVDADLPGEHVG